MEQEFDKYGILLNKDIKLHRKHFKEFAKLHGIKCIYRAPIPGKTFDTHGDLEANYQPGVIVNAIFHEFPDQKTMKKMGWVAELQENEILIEVPYDLADIQVGALFIVPSGIDNAEGRVFRVTSMQTIMVYPYAITCAIAPEYFDRDEPNLTKDFKQENFTMLIDNEEDD